MAAGLVAEAGMGGDAAHRKAAVETEVEEWAALMVAPVRAPSTTTATTWLQWQLQMAQGGQHAHGAASVAGKATARDHHRLDLLGPRPYRLEGLPVAAPRAP